MGMGIFDPAQSVLLLLFQSSAGPPSPAQPKQTKQSNNRF
jgi:hypothetical protein